MKDQILIINYLNKESYRLSFNKLALNTFGLDFEEWYQKKLFHNRYFCYSYLFKDEIIANVSINMMDLVIDGKRKKAIQIGTVMVHPDYRGQGLSSELMNHVIERYEKDYDIIYLFANKSVLDFYPKFGFKKIIESAYELDVKQLDKKESNIKKLNTNIEEDYKTISRLAADREPISQKLGVYNDIWPLLVYCLYEFKEDLYYLEDKEVIVIARREEGELHIYDVLSLKAIDLDNIIERFVRADDKKIEFHFIPELTKYEVNSYLKERPDSTLFVRSQNTSFNEVLFPMTSHT